MHMYKWSGQVRSDCYVCCACMLSDGKLVKHSYIFVSMALAFVVVAISIAQESFTITCTTACTHVHTRIASRDAYVV